MSFFSGDGSVRPRSSRGRSDMSGGGRSTFDFFKWNDEGAKMTTPSEQRDKLTNTYKTRSPTKTAGLHSRSGAFVGGSVSYRMHGDSEGGKVNMNSSRPGFEKRVKDTSGDRIVFGGAEGNTSGIAPVRDHPGKTSQRKQDELYASVNIFGGGNAKPTNFDKFHHVRSQKMRDLDGENSAIPHVVANREVADRPAPAPAAAPAREDAPPPSAPATPVPAALRDELASVANHEANGTPGAKPAPSSKSPGKRPGSATNKTKFTFDGASQKVCSPEQLRQWQMSGSFTPRVRPSPGGNATYKFGEAEKPSRLGFMTSTKRLPPGGYSNISIQ